MEKKSENMFSRFDTIPACDRQTDGQSCHSIVRAYAQYRAVKPKTLAYIFYV